MNIERYYDIKLSEIDADNLFFSVVAKAKEKGIFMESELLYIDSSLNDMISETARLCGKGYIKEDSAKIMLRNIFMILDSVFSVTDITEIIEAVKQKKLTESWQKGVRESIAFFDRTKKNIYHLEHFYYKNPSLLADFAIKLKNDYAFTNIYTHSFERATFTKAFFLLNGNESYKTVCDKSEILCTECDILSGLEYEDILPIINERGLLRADGGIKYTQNVIDAIIISMCFSAFYRCEGIFPGKEYAKEILSELVSTSEEELRESFESYIRMIISRYKVEIVEKEASYGENILNVYASRVSEDNIILLAKHLAEKTVSKRKTEKGLINLINFN